MQLRQVYNARYIIRLREVCERLTVLGLAVTEHQGVRGDMKPTGESSGAFFRASFVLQLLLLGAAGDYPMVMAQSTGTFTATGNMTTTRAGHTATLLFNGKVLIAGGDRPAASAEFYDPSAGTFSPAGAMTAARVGHTATLLPDGRVLIAGGDGPLASAELYDPSTGTFTATGSMITPAFPHTATLLGNGKVLIAGGSTAELYDPATGTFAVTGAYAGSYTGPLYFDTATLLPDGRVLITGCDCGSNPAPATELYDPGTGTFSLTGTMSGTAGLWWEEVNTATLLRNGRVLIAGNFENDGLPADAEVYDASTRTFTGIGNTIATHEFSTATLLPDGTVLIAGGAVPGGNGAPGADLYAPATGNFYLAGNMTTGRHQHTATLLRDGTVLIPGGFSIWPAPNASAELYHPSGIQGTPTVQIVDNNTGSLTTLAVGDSFSFLVTGAPPFSLVFVSEPRWSASVGYTDSSGSFRLTGTVAASVVGTWQQTWTIGGLGAQPSPLHFTITGP